MWSGTLVIFLGITTLTGDLISNEGSVWLIALTKLTGPQHRDIWSQSVADISMKVFF